MPPERHLVRNAVILLTVLALHAGALWAMQTGLLWRGVPPVMPLRVISELITPQVVPPAVAPERVVPPQPLPPRPRAAPPAPRLHRPPVPPPPQPAALLALADSAPAAPTDHVVAAASPAPAPEPAPAAPAPRVVLPSARADYLSNPPPVYPPMSRRLGEQGKVILRVLIGADGLAKEAHLARSSGFERLDQAALETVRQWRYRPGMRDGVAEAMWFNVPINFVLEGVL
ncbi:energy transducer TonB [Ottowia testudinis]|uniref:Energy transducer TonB n=1 Tax=Ottowia testudinis TaxID=2816950 RepID=A0A975CEW6_9BURK|nr:energy transducer TonB [Ottowia testudinis]QTD45125.1 energy transducer TonB [Ottowia testudinis]